MAMSANPHMQHPGMNQAMDPATMQQQVAAMNAAAAANGNGPEYGQQPMSDQNRAYIEQQLRMQQQHQQQQQGRDGKVAAQRALGVGAQVQNPQQMLQQQQQMMMQQGIRQMTTANGSVYVDAQGRQISLPMGWQPQMSDPRQPPASMVSQAQLQAFYQQQQQQQQAQQAQQQAQQHHAQQQQQQQMLPPQQALHYQRQQQLAQQQQQQRASQPPSARPPHAPPPQLGPGQSPALLQVPPPPVKRAVSRAASRSASPIPPHIQPPSAMGQPMQASTSAMATTGAPPTILPLRSATVPVTNGEGSQIHFAENTIHPRPTAVSAKPTDSKFARLQSTQLSRPVQYSRAGRVQRYEEKTSRLQRIVDQAQAALIVAQKEAEDAKAAQEKAKVDEDPQIGFDTALLDYLQRAGYGAAASALSSDIAKSHPSRKDGTSSGDVTLVETTEEAKSITISPNKTGSPVKAPISATDLQGETPSQSKSSPKDEQTPTDSIFGPEKGESSSPSKTNDDRIKEEKSSPHDKASTGQSPQTATSSNGQSALRDLGDLYTWWVIFQDSKRILAKRNAANKATASQPNTAAPTTGITPSSAVAARIAMANPAAAVRAASVDFAGQRGQAGPSHHAQDDPVPVTATLQQVEAMKRDQAAKIQAEQEAHRRRMEMQSGMQDGRQVLYQNGQSQGMTPEQLQSIYQQQQQLHAQQRHLQPQNTGLQHPQQQIYQQMPVTTPGGTVRHMPTQMMMQQQNGVVGSPSNSSPQGQKRGADGSPMDNQSAKKAKMVGKQPTPEDHRRQALELAKSAMPAPGILQLPGQQQRSMSQQQEMPRPSLEAQRQYSQTQAAYAKQQELAVRQHIANSPAQMTGMSPAQMTPAQMTEQSPMGMTSPSMQHNAQFEVGMNGMPTQQETPTMGNRGKKGKPGAGLTVDTETAAEAPEATPAGASGKRKASANKKLPKSATEKMPKGKNAKVRKTGSASNSLGNPPAWLTAIMQNQQGVKGGRPSTADASNSQIDESPFAPTPSQGYGIAQTPTSNNPSIGEMNYGPGPGSAPGSSRSQVFQLPPVNEPVVNPGQTQPMENGLDASGTQLQQPQQQQQQLQMQVAQPQQVVQQPQPQQQQQQQQQPVEQQPAFDTNFGFDDTADFLKSFDFSAGGMQMPNSADYGSFNFDDFNFTNVGDNQDDWTSLDGGLS
ncbi:hypothetical protein L486_02788 [Kwoniella mangroviensis CBS 10435]|uniref:LisH domain-containing protein n=1 Tax=Kwoniella mangroviensis CBS 10435 TaxID=1331196 RepID=A0A1B9IX47_9TREE|nr:hypothetical protein L486_02788 [Kwoniella mangroviensis CBS 10435]